MTLWHNGERDPRELAAHPRNPRTHSEAQVAELRASIRRFGFTNPVLVDVDGTIIAGHARTLAAIAEGLEFVPTRERVITHPLTEPERLALIVGDNQLALNAGWDDELLGGILEELRAADFDLSLTGFSTEQLDALLRPGSSSGPVTRGVPIAASDAAPELQQRAVSREGDVWLCGRNRVMCGDSTDAAHVEQLMGAQPQRIERGAALLHADPPYGMGKENDGVENDNLYRDELVKFQALWWATWRPYLEDNASAYVWGTAEELWRFWYSGLRESERLTFRNEIVWDKETCIGMASDSHRQYPTATERCLFFMLGQQFMGNVNKDDFWEGFEPLRGYLEAEAIAAELRPKDVQRICGVGMYGHWFSRSQWTMIPERHYQALREATGRFGRPYAELRRAYDGKMGDDDRTTARETFYALRAQFDNTHDAMTDVWRYARVQGEERYGHATPKPVQMIGRALKSSTREGDIVLEPFAGTGTTLIAAAALGRACYTMDLTPQYVDVTVRRWQQMTGEQARRESDGRGFDVPN